ncbi:hypothetical protein [Streptomyces profundus]|uniref:hypothetical protein n=1 Tax=Streptomyces profundus TaxID=2867410 RepID=UPI001D16C6DE|nr:hypothetical protein [Streptomyces sp. MA3_2.13]UED84726.1 hypothetical protein K4G22_11340 [Streptomyces sp. MA3_2.13]
MSRFALLAVMLVALLGAVLSARFLVGGETPDDDERNGALVDTSAPSPDEVEWGEATATGALASRVVSGLPRGFPRSEAGAVEAGTTFAAATSDLLRMAGDDRTAYVRDAMLDPPSVRRLDEDASNFRERHGLSDSGGSSDDERFVSECHPELGAYRVVDYTSERSVVDFWMPCLLGTVDDAGAAVEMATRWEMGRVALEWKGNDWRVEELTAGPFNEPVMPEDAGDPVTELTMRLALLGHDWQLYADANEETPPEARTGESR